jgi:tRNA pseudouridine13 synthase
MKLKQTPGDFRVEELTAVRETAGEFAFYRLDKVGWTTPDALQIVCRKWQLPWDAISYGGLKDRHADTTQYLTVYRGPRRDLAEQRMDLVYLGQLPHPYSSRDIAANRFAVVVRHLTADEEAALIAAVADVRAFGLPNYFDDQRFGSVTPDGQFIGRELVFGRFETALKLALAAPYEFDRAESKDEKRILTENWGDWPKCKAKLPRSHARSLVTYLADHPTDFRGAIARLRPELQGMYLSAFQSELWNRMLARWLTTNLPAADLGGIDLHRGRLPVPTKVPAEALPRWQTLMLPLPCARLKPDPTADWNAHAEAVLTEEGLTLKALKVPGLNKPFFSKGDRVGCLRPEGLSAEAAADDLNPGRRKVTLRFDLPRGCYATMVVKRLTAANIEE